MAASYDIKSDEFNLTESRRPNTLFVRDVQSDHVYLKVTAGEEANNENIFEVVYSRNARA